MPIAVPTHGVDEDEERHAAQDVDDGAERKVYGAVGSEPILGGDGEDEAERQTDDIGEEGDGDGHVYGLAEALENQIEHVHSSSVKLMPWLSSQRRILSAVSGSLGSWRTVWP